MSRNISLTSTSTHTPNTTSSDTQAANLAARIGGDAFYLELQYKEIPDTRVATTIVCWALTLHKTALTMYYMLPPTHGPHTQGPQGLMVLMMHVVLTTIATTSVVGRTNRLFSGDFITQGVKAYCYNQVREGRREGWRRGERQAIIYRLGRQEQLIRQLIPD